MFFYSDTQPKSAFNGNIWGMNATKIWASHYDNLLFLQFIVGHDKASFAEKHQANKEIPLCEKKLTFWARHPNFVKREADNLAIEAKKKWTPK
jgi:hypothetical protein